VHVCIGCHFSTRYLINYICVFSLQPVQQQRNRRLSIVVVVASRRQSVPICSRQTQINSFKQIDHSSRESYATIRNNPNLFNREIISRHRDEQQFEYDRHRLMICTDRYRCNRSIVVRNWSTDHRLWTKHYHSGIIAKSLSNICIISRINLVLNYLE